ncbi:hypothetical protein SEVCU012_0588, partial [Staphylococcus pettenkoferi VCU012]
MRRMNMKAVQLILGASAGIATGLGVVLMNRNR